MAPIDFSTLFSRWQTIMLLSSEDRKKLVAKLHPHTVIGIETAARIGTDAAKIVLNENNFPNIDDYGNAIGISLAGAALTGYSLFLMSRAIDPLQTHLHERNLDALPDKYSEALAEDQNKRRIESIPIEYKLLCDQSANAYINQLIALYPVSVKQPYQLIERIHQHVNWAVLQGFCLGLIEEELLAIRP